MSNNVLLFDLETLSTRANAVVLSMGLLIADPEKKYSYGQLIDQGLHIKFDVREQIDSGRHVSKSTMEWWKGQGQEAQKILKASEDDVSFYNVADYIREYGESMAFDFKKCHAFSRGPSFDAAIIENLCQSEGTENPIPYWNFRDIRTFIDTVSGTTRGKLPNWNPHPNTILHNALHDCANDFLQMQEAVRLANEN